MNRTRHRQRLARHIILGRPAQGLRDLILFEDRTSRALFLKDLELIADAYVAAQEK